MSLSLAPAQAICDRDVIAERWRQLRKWGPQSHPDGTGTNDSWADAAALYRKINDETPQGQHDWLHILLEEVYEAFAETESTALRAELIQVAAVCVAWVECLDNRAGDRAAVLHPLDQLEPVAA